VRTADFIMAPPAIQEKLQLAFESLSKAYHDISKDSNVDRLAKMQLMEAAQDIINAVQAPQEARQIFVMRNAVHPCYRIAANCGILTALSKESKPMSAKKLAEKTSADERLIGIY